VNPVRPTLLPIAPAPAQRPDAARQAFFKAALGQALAPATQLAAQSVAAEPAPAPVRVQRMPDLGAEAPAKILRPGSLLDIRV
jgi:hypothetical protein